MGALMRSFDFSATPLGPAAEWPQSLRSAVSICLNNRFPIVLFWGPRFLTLYNDAYTPILGNKHPWALGQPFEVVWADIWDVLGPVLRGVFETGVPSWAEDQQLIFQRSGYAEEVYFTFSFGAGLNEQGDVGGIFCAVTETTQRVLHERRLAILKELSADARTIPEAARITAEVLGHTPDIPFALLYLKEKDGLRAALASHCGLPEHSAAAPASLDLKDEQEPWLLNSAPSDGMTVLTDLDGRFGPLPGRPWPEPATSAVVLSLKQAGQSDDAGYLILGISPRRAFDEAYRRFFELVGNHVATLVSNARACEEQRKRAEALAELDRAKTAFFSNVSHEFRTPLTLMLGPVEELLAKSHTDLSPASKGQLEIVHRNGLRLLRLVNSLLDFSRIEAGRVQARYEATDLAAFTAELASSFRSATERAGLDLIVDCPPLSEPIYVDRDMWEKIVLNLVSNAFKFTLEGQINVTLRQHDHVAELVVRDTGVGIPAEAMSRLFERFYRVDNMRSRTYEGSGIGLALVQELVKLHGGKVRVQSKIGEGSAFIVTVPLGRAHLPEEKIGTARNLASTATGALPFVEEALRWLPEQATDEREELPRNDLLPVTCPASKEETLAGRPRILLADDNADMRQYVARLLAEHYAVDAVADGEAALASAQARRPDLVLTDVMMPKLDGFGLLKALRGDPLLEALPVILLSARAGEESRVEGLEHGADDYLIKPFSARELLARVHAHIEMACVRRENEERAAMDLQAMTRLYEVGVLCTATGSQFKECVREILDAAIRVTGAEKGNIQLLDEKSGTLTIVAQRGFEEPFLRFFQTVHLEKGAACGTALHHARRIVVKDVTKSEVFAGTASLPVLLEARVGAVQSTPLVSSGGRVVGVISTHFAKPHAPNERELRMMDLVAQQAGDYLERKRAEDKLRESEARFRALAETSPLGVGVSSAEGKILYTNRAYEEILGYEPGELLGRPSTAIYCAPVDRQAWLGLLKDTGWVSDYEVRLRRKDGTQVWVEMNACPIQFDGNQAIIGTVQDVTERKQAQAVLARDKEDLERLVAERTERLQELVEELEHFSYTITHDMRAPLRAMRAFSEMLRDAGQDRLSKEERGFAARIVTGAERMDNLIADALSYSKAVRSELPLAAVDLGRLLRGILDTYPELQAARADISVEGELPVVMGNEAGLTQCFSNLLGNAVKFAKPDSRAKVRVGSERRDGWVRLWVEDEGIGISKELQPRVFEMFSRGSSPQAGTGIGLALVRKVVDRMGGHVGVDSELGKGSRFWVELKPDDVKSSAAEIVRIRSSTV
jgi:PAS domain S-box-containing protein